MAAIGLLAFLYLWIWTAQSHSLFRPHFINSTEYDAGLYGAYPHQKYRSVDLESPVLNILKWDAQCDNRYTLIGPRTKHTPRPGPMILDAKGNLVWTSSNFGAADDVQVQEYKGEKFLTFWAGVHLGNYWPGYWYMLDSSYQVRHILSPADIEYGDNHEFKILEGGTALITVFRTVHVMGKEGFGSGWIRDSYFQEIDLATGRLLFEWRASDHIDMTESYMPPGHLVAKDDPYEWFHINSVDKDSFGNYLISSRYLFMVAYINGIEGHVVWTLGGKNSDFKDLSDGAASNFTFQHHATFLGSNHPLSGAQGNNSDIITLSLFDNAAIGHRKGDTARSRAMIIDLDTSKMTATLVHEYVNPRKQVSLSQGSVNVLPDSNNLLVGWGASPAWTEYLPDGTVLCDVHFGPYAFWESSFAQSYRVYQIPEKEWVGKPSYPPDISIGNGENGRETVFASWNGATHVDRWRLQGSHRLIHGHPHRMEWETLQVALKDGFEVTFSMVDVEDDIHGMPFAKRHGDGDELYTHQYIRVQALGKKGHVLKSSWIADRHTRLIIDPHGPNLEWRLSDAQIAPLLLVIALSSLSLALYWLFKGRFKQPVKLDPHYAPLKP